jgi:hypothetical protein
MEATIRERELDGLARIAAAIRDELFAPIRNRKTAIFICGAGKEKRDSVRSAIRHELTRNWYSYKYEILLPEDFFDELLYGKNRCDLIELETVLAESVDALLMIPESWGAVTELGAFSMNKDLRRKMICLQDVKHKKTESFINFGPVRLIRDSKEGKVLYVDYTKIPPEMEKIRRAISDVAAGPAAPARADNIAQAPTFLLLAIYLLEPATQQTLLDLVSSASGGVPSRCRAVTFGALGLLRKRKWVTGTPKGFTLTEAGVAALNDLGRHGVSKSYFNIDVMDRIRADVLTWMYRNKSFRKGA